MNKPLLRSNDMPSSNAISGVTSQGASEQAVTTDAAAHAHIRVARHLPTQACLSALQVCGPETGHVVRAVGYVDSPARDDMIASACNAYPRLVAALRYYAIPGMADNGDKARALLRELGEI
jgi:hypothetical protein